MVESYSLGRQTLLIEDLGVKPNSNSSAFILKRWIYEQQLKNPAQFFFNVIPSPAFWDWIKTQTPVNIFNIDMKCSIRP